MSDGTEKKKKKRERDDAEEDDEKSAKKSKTKPNSSSSKKGSKQDGKKDKKVAEFEEVELPHNDDRCQRSTNKKTGKPNKPEQTLVFYNKAMTHVFCLDCANKGICRSQKYFKDTFVSRFDTQFDYSTCVQSINQFMVDHLIPKHLDLINAAYRKAGMNEGMTMKRMGRFVSFLSFLHQYLHVESSRRRPIAHCCVVSSPASFPSGCCVANPGATFVPLSTTNRLRSRS
jgi:hypothetical protein